jgi:alkanesulfonate monooxygenase SsuD/methylene tetrahydromethanopterin reductase-like flavin-dependent oxidoreductase (luciferase family)
VLDCVSGGRIDVVFGAGYARHEFAMFGLDPRERVARVEEGVAAVKAAWTGQPFEHRRRRVTVRPTPLQQPRPPIWLGGSSPAAARRAARIADYFYTGEQALYDVYREEARRLGADPGPWRDIGSGFLVVAEDPDAEWARLAPYIEHEVQSYQSWIGGSGDATNAYQFVDLSLVRASGAYPILTPAAARAYADARGADGDLTVHPLIAGLPPAIAWEHLERLRREVLPHVLGARTAATAA